MHNDKITDFDLEFREIFHDAEEEVPSRIWDSLSEELDRRERRKVVALWWKRAAAGVAVAAAVMSGIFMLSDHSAPVQPSVTPMVAEAPVQTETSPEIPSIEEQIASSSQLYMADIPQTHRAEPSEPSSQKPAEVVPAESFDTGMVPEESTTVYAAPVPVQKETADVPENVTRTEGPAEWTDPFALLEDEEPQSSHDISFSVSGNVMSNDATGNASGAHRAPVIGNVQTTGITEKSTSTYGIPLSLGLGAEISLNDRWSIGTGINWTLLSRSFTGIYSEVENGSLIKSINSDINNEIHYIGIPLNFYYNVLTNRNLKFYAWGGGMAEKGLVNKYRIHSQPEDIFYKESVSGLQWSAGLGLGLEFALKDNLGLYIDPSARYYFDCNQPTSVRTQKPYMLNFEVGLRFNL